MIMKNETKTKNFSVRAAMMLLMTVLTMTAQTARAQAVTLSVDNEIAEGTAGHWFVNMPATDTNTLTLSNAT